MAFHPHTTSFVSEFKKRLSFSFGFFPFPSTFLSTFRLFLFKFNFCFKNSLFFLIQFQIFKIEPTFKPFNIYRLVLEFQDMLTSKS